MSRTSKGEQQIHSSGCLNRAEEWMSRNVTIVSSLALVVAFVQSNEQCLKIHCDGCLIRGGIWLEKYFALVGGVVFVVVVIEILGICFAQNLRSDVLAQRARWERER
uniref:Uncharacterized protein n=1 Tax=Romanomermis culicivorax TaxID=13658 RepID=A0A915HHP5_ROMCU